MEGNVLNRYKLLERIRQDKIFEKYIAYDIIKKELVLFKICNIHYGKNTRLGENLLKKFKIYSILTHQNIFKIFDFGYTDDKFYIVQEYIKGDYLDRIISRQEDIDVERSLKIVISILQGLKILEDNFLSHGNINSNSIFIGEKNEVKIDDIGLNLLMFPILENLSISDDIYNTGGILQELLTIAYITKKDKLTFSKSIENILYKIRDKNISNRYQNISSLLNDLSLAISEFEVKTTVIEDVKTFPKPRKRETVYPLQNKRTKKVSFFSIPSFLIIILFLILFGIYYYLLFPSYETTVPNIINLNVAEAEKLLKKQGLKLHIQNIKFDPDKPDDVILEQRPLPLLKKVKAGKTIFVVVNKKPHLTPVPDLKGLDRRSAEILIEDSNFKIGNITTVASNEIEKGKVVNQEPLPNTKAFSGTSINLQISSGPSKVLVEIPDFRGLLLEEAKTKITQMKLKLGQINKILSEDLPDGQIISQNPIYGTKVEEGTAIDFNISAKTTSGYAQKKETEIEITVPEGKEQQNVKILVIDEKGDRIVYDKVHKASDKIKVDVESIGKTTIKVYIDGNLIKEENI